MRAPIPVPEVQRLAPYTVETAGRRGLLRLDFNEHTSGPSPRVLARLSEITAEDLAMYPDESGARAAIRRHFAFDELVDFVLTSGADEAIRLVCDAFVQSGQRVAILDPGYAMYRFYATLAGADIEPSRSSRISAFPSRACGPRSTKASGLSFSAIHTTPQERRFRPGWWPSWHAPAPDVVILVDEAYAEFAGRTALPLLSQLPNVLVARTFSKAYGLAGLRIGCLAGHRETVAWPARMRSPYAVNAVALLAVEAALDDPAWAASYAAEVRSSRETLREGLARLGVPTRPSDANFVIARFGDAAPRIRGLLRARGVLVRDRSGHPLLHGTLRIGVGTHRDTARCLRELEEVLLEIGYRERTPR